MPIPGELIFGTQRERGFLVDNVLRSPVYGDIHFSSIIPESYDGSEPYALFLTLPGWEGLYFQGVGANLVEYFGDEALNYNDKMIVLSPQLSDWGQRSAEETIVLTEFFLTHYNVDHNRVYLEGYSGGGETGSLVMGTKPELFAGYLMCSSQWDGDLSVLATAQTPVYLVTGENDSYYGSDSMKRAYAELCAIYRDQGMTEGKIAELAVLDVKSQSWFDDRDIRDQHAGGFFIAYEPDIMGWLFAKQRK